MGPFSRREFLSSSAGLSAAALVAADLKLAEAARENAISNSTPTPGGTPGWEIGPFEDLRDWMAELERRGLVLRVRNIDQDAYEGTALMYRLIDKFGMYFAPALVMENVKIDGVWHKGPIVTNHCGHWDTECLSFGLEPVPNDHIATYHKALARVEEFLQLGKGGAFPTAPFAEIRREDALCKQVVLTGDAIDLRKFAFIQSNPADSARYVNTGSVFTNDAERGINFGT